MTHDEAKQNTKIKSQFKNKLRLNVCELHDDRSEPSKQINAIMQ